MGPSDAAFEGLMKEKEQLLKDFEVQFDAMLLVLLSYINTKYSRDSRCRSCIFVFKVNMIVYWTQATEMQQICVNNQFMAILKSVHQKTTKQFQDTMTSIVETTQGKMEDTKKTFSGKHVLSHNDSRSY